MARRTPRRTVVLCGVVALAVTAAVGFTWKPWEWFSIDRGFGTWSNRTNQTFTAPGGRSSLYHVYASGLSRDAVVGLVFWFHGDGAYEFENPTSPYALGGPNGIVAQAVKRGYVVVAPLTPDHAGPTTWWEDGAALADYADALIGTLAQQYPGGADNIWLAGYSGGSQFITQFYLPLHGDRLPGGGAVLFAGGGEPYSVTPRPVSARQRAAFPMFWYTGAGDDGRRSEDGYDALGDPVHGARAGLAYYTAAGYPTGHEWVPGAGHDLDDRFGGVLAAQLDRHAR